MVLLLDYLQDGVLFGQLVQRTTMRVGPYPLVKQHVGVLAALVAAPKTFTFKVVGDVPGTNSLVVELKPLLVDFDQRVVVSALRRPRMYDDSAESVVEILGILLFPAGHSVPTEF